MTGLNKFMMRSAENRSEYPPLYDGVIQSVTLVDQWVRPDADAFETRSGPGHLLHFVTEGETMQCINGQEQRLVPGDCVWRHENEVVQGRILKTPWICYAVSFSANRLPPPPPENRVWRPQGDVSRHFQMLLHAWRNVSAPSVVRHMRVLERMLKLLLYVMPPVPFNHRWDAHTRLWWDIEAKVRQDLSQPIDLRRLQALVRRNKHSIIRACHSAVGMTPMKRIKEIRLTYARNLVLQSHLPMTEIALRVGYSRVQELSRDYNRRYGAAPTEDRRAGGDGRALPPSLLCSTMSDRGLRTMETMTHCDY